MSASPLATSGQKSGKVDCSLSHHFPNFPKFPKTNLSHLRLRVAFFGPQNFDFVLIRLTTTCATAVHFLCAPAKVEKANGGDNEELRNYKNACVLKARQGAVMVSPFISPDEKEVMQVLLKEKSPFILLTDNGFRDYYKPTDILFDACAAGRLLILSPWSYDSGKRHISRADCVALNAMAEEIANSLTGEV